MFILTFGYINIYIYIEQQQEKICLQMDIVRQRYKVRHESSSFIHMMYGSINVYKY